MIVQLRLPDPADHAALGGYLERLLALDRAAAVRVVGIGEVAAVFSAPPLGSTGSIRGAPVLAVRTLALAAGSERFDRTVSAGRLLDALGARPEKPVQADGLATEPRVDPASVPVSGTGDGPDPEPPAAPTTVLLPDPLLGGPAWAGLLPPRAGWRPIAVIPISRLAEVVAQGNADFRFGALGRDRAGLDALAEQIWNRELPGAVHWRSAHAASAMGFLGPDPGRAQADARIAALTGWLRLDTPFGTVIERAPGLRPTPSAG